MAEHIPFRNARVNQALMFATIAHGNQVRKGNLYVPYVFHPIDVAYEVICYAGLPASELDDTVVIALLHDTVEDTAVTLDDIFEHFGKAVRDGVAALTKDYSLDAGTGQDVLLQENLARLSQSPARVQAVKMGDRISNLKVFPSFWSRDKIRTYLDQSVLIAKTLGDASEGLQARLLARVGEARTMLSLIPA